MLLSILSNNEQLINYFFLYDFKKEFLSKFNKIIIHDNL